MKNTRASERYAKSLLMLSIEKKILDEVKADVDLIIKSFVDEGQIKKNLYNNVVDDGKEYWTLSGKKAERWIPGLSKKNK